MKEYASRSTFLYPLSVSILTYANTSSAPISNPCLSAQNEHAQFPELCQLSDSANYRTLVDIFSFDHFFEPMKKERENLNAFPLFFSTFFYQISRSVRHDALHTA